MTQTNEVGDVINSINNIQINGQADVMTGIKVAQLSLKHRMNKSQRQRIIVFVGHPIVKGTEEDFEDLGMRLKKNNVSIDVINFANPDNIGRLTAMVNCANDGSEDKPTCHFLDVPLGCSHIIDVMMTSPILQPEDMGMGGAPVGGNDNGGGAANNDPMAGLGFDPSMDPELAAAIRMSLEEAKQAEQPAPEEEKKADVPVQNPPSQFQVNEDDDDGLYSDDEPADDDDKALKEALALSMG